MTAIDWDALTRAAIATREHAHAPYSRYRVGAALVTEDGMVHAGCNVENATYGLTICAERTAVVSMVAAGGKRVAAIAVVTRGPTAGSPCGACRQTLAEFAGDAPVLMLAVDDDGVILDRRASTVDTLLPDAFRGDRLLGDG